MNQANAAGRLRLFVVTGDHQTRDPTKHGAGYAAQDFETHAAMVAAIESLDRFDLEVCSDHRTLFDRLTESPPDLVVNFCDTGVFNRPDRELNLPAWLELHDLPHTGASPQAMAICFDKQLVRLAAEAIGVETPRESFLSAGRPIDALPDFYPALLKPNTADGSVGITKDAVVRNEAEARRYLEFLRRELPGADVLWQDYLPGPEYGLGLIGNPEASITAFPPLEVDFSKLPAGANPILSFESKTDPASPYWTDITFRRAELDTATAARMEDSAKVLFRRLGLRDYGRFDFRCAEDGHPRLMEVNPNPAWANDGKLAFMAGFAGVPYPRMLEMIIDAALERTSAF